jgi:DNA ligase-1
MVNNAPLSERREILSTMFKPNEVVRLAESVVGSRAKHLFERVVHDGGEGIVVKNLHSRYVPASRSPTWMKFKKCETVDVQVVGATTSDALSFGSLILVKDGKYFGKVGTGFTDRQREEIFGILRANPDDSDFARWGVPADVKREVAQVCKPLDAEVKMLEACRGGRPRHPVWVRWKLQETL